MTDTAWPRVRLEELTTKVGSGSTPRGGEAAYKKAGVPFIRSMNVVFFGFKRDGLAYLDEEQALALQNVEVRDGDILLNITGASIGRVTLAPKDMNGARVNQHVCIIRPRDIVDARFLRAFLSSPEMQSAITAENYGVTRQALTKRQILDFKIPLPPQGEQRRIAEKLGALLARVDACRQRLDRVPAILKQFRQAVLSAAISGELTAEWRESRSASADAMSLAESVRATHKAAGGHSAGNAAPPTKDVHDLVADMFPSGWVLMELRELVSPERPITYGILKPGPELERGVPYIRVADFPNDKLNLTTIRRTSPAIDQEFKRSRLRPGDLVLSIRGTVGRLVMIPAELDRANITQDSARLSIQEQVSTKYVLWYLRSGIAQTRMQKAIKGVAVRGINIGDVRALQVPMPSREEQDEIVRRVEELLAFADRLQVQQETAVGHVERLTPSILSKAFRGHLVPQDPNDESAMALLEKLRADPTAAGAAGKSKRPRTKTRQPMSKDQKDTIKEAIQKLRKSSFSFDELREHVTCDYDTLKDAVFALLEGPSPVLRQVFDNKAQAMRLVRVKS